MTHREREVATLVAEGLTDKEIGKALGIAENTVGAHVTHIARALGIPRAGNTRVHITRAMLGVRKRVIGGDAVAA